MIETVNYAIDVFEGMAVNLDQMINMSLQFARFETPHHNQKNTKNRKSSFL